MINGTTGDDTLAGGAGNDTLNPGPGNDTAIGGDGGDFFIAASGAGDDIYIGGTDIEADTSAEDRISFASEDGVKVDLGGFIGNFRGTATTIHADGSHAGQDASEQDKIFGIEHVDGSSGADLLLGQCRCK